MVPRLGGRDVVSGGILRKLGIGLAFLTGLGQLGAQPSWAVQVDLAGSLTQNLKDATGDRVGLAPGLVLENPHSKDWALRGRAEACRECVAGDRNRCRRTRRYVGEPWPTGLASQSQSSNLAFRRGTAQ